MENVMENMKTGKFIKLNANRLVFYTPFTTFYAVQITFEYGSTIIVLHILETFFN